MRRAKAAGQVVDGCSDEAHPAAQARNQRVTTGLSEQQVRVAPYCIERSGAVEVLRHSLDTTRAQLGRLALEDG